MGTEAVSPEADTLPSDGASGPRPVPDVDPLVGRTLGHFRVDAPLGRGGMGTVYRAWDASLERVVALKVVVGGSEAARERFLREARVQAKLRHPNVVPIHFVGVDGNVSFLVMDLVDGAALADVLATGPLAEARAIDVADSIAAALAAGSEVGLVHRDVKPSNVLVERSGRVMLADYGLAKSIAHEAPAPAPEGAPDGSPNLTHHGAILGTPAYIAPEQARGEPVDARADMYALGATLYEMLVGSPPFQAPTAAALLLRHLHEPPPNPCAAVPSLRAPVGALVLRLLSKKPEDRFASFGELRGAIEAARERPVALATFVVRAVAYTIDLVFVTVVWSVLVLLLKSALLTGLIILVALAELERVWSTPGKRAMRIRVEGLGGEQLSRGRVVLRSLVRFWGALALAVLADLHDLLGKGVPGLGFALAVLAVLAAHALTLVAGTHWRTLHDRVARSREVFAR